MRCRKFACLGHCCVLCEKCVKGFAWFPQDFEPFLAQSGSRMTRCSGADTNQRTISPFRVLQGRNGSTARNAHLRSSITFILMRCTNKLSRNYPWNVNNWLIEEDNSACGTLYPRSVDVHDTQLVASRLQVAIVGVSGVWRLTSCAGLVPFRCLRLCNDPCTRHWRRPHVLPLATYLLPALTRHLPSRLAAGYAWGGTPGFLDQRSVCWIL